MLSKHQYPNLSKYVISPLCVITLSLTLSSCSPERRAVLRLTTLSFKAQASDAISATKEIYRLTPNARPNVQRKDILIRRLLTDNNLDYRDQETVDKVITRTLGQVSHTPSSVDQALDDLRQEYIVAAETFENIEKGGLLGTESGAVAEAAEPFRRLTVKMLLLAQIIRQSPPSPKSSDKVWIYYQFDQLRTRYTLSNSEVERMQIQQSTNKLLEELLTMNAEESKLVCLATSKLLLTAQTGTKLSKLIDNYSRLSIDEIMAKISTAFGIASSLSGSNLSSVIAKITEIKKDITDDPVLNRILNEIPKETWATNDSEATPLNCPQ